MRILHVLDHSLPLQSGYAFRTRAILREQRRIGWDTRQLTTARQGGADARFDDVDGWRFERTPLASNALDRIPGVRYVREMLATARRIGEIASDFRPDVIHAHSPVLNVLPALWVGRRLGVPVAYEVRALWEDAAVDHGVTQEGSPRYRISRALETFALRRVDRVTTICEGLRMEIGKRGVSPGCITVIPNAVDVNDFRFGSPADAQLRAELGLNGMTVIGFAGSFYGYEGLDLLVKAVAELSASDETIHALLIGGGPQEGNLRKLAERCGVAERVHFTGRVPHHEVHRYYDLIDVLAYPRRRMRLTELVTPLKPLEAMAQGRMFVASDVGGHRELVVDGETGFLCRADDVSALVSTIRKILSLKAEWPRVRDRARRHVETDRNWARSVAMYSAVYQSLLDRPSAARATTVA